MFRKHCDNCPTREECLDKGECNSKVEDDFKRKVEHDYLREDFTEVKTFSHLREIDEYESLVNDIKEASED